MNRSYRINDIYSALDKLGINRLDVLVTGVTGAGKSTTLNSLFELERAKVGYGVDPETTDVNVYDFNDKFYLWDSPGLGDGVARDKKHSKKIIDLLFKNYGDKKYQWIDLVLVLIEGSNRDMGTSYKLLNDIIVPNFPSDKILVAINKADMAKSGFYWDGKHNSPEAPLQQFLDEFTLSLQRRIKEATGVTITKPIYYSAIKNYNMNILMDYIINNIPTRLDKVK